MRRPSEEVERVVDLQVGRDRLLVRPPVDGEVRQAASNGLMVVDAPSTPRLIAEARSSTPALTAELGELEARFARNPARVQR